MDRCVCVVRPVVTVVLHQSALIATALWHSTTPPSRAVLGVSVANLQPPSPPPPACLLDRERRVVQAARPESMISKAHLIGMRDEARGLRPAGEADANGAPHCLAFALLLLRCLGLGVVFHFIFPVFSRLLRRLGRWRW